MKKTILLTLSIIILQSCAFDQKEYTKTITGKYALRKWLNPITVVSLEFQNDSICCTGIIDGCELVEFDTLNNIIFVKQNRNHVVIKLGNPNNVDDKPIYTKSQFSEKDFQSALDSCTNCVTQYPTKDF